MKMYDLTYCYEDNQKIIYLVYDKQAKFVTFATPDKESAIDQIKEDEKNYPGHQFSIVCYPVDLEEIVYLLELFVNND